MNHLIIIRTIIRLSYVVSDQMYAGWLAGVLKTGSTTLGMYWLAIGVGCFVNYRLSQKKVTFR